MHLWQVRVRFVFSGAIELKEPSVGYMGEGVSRCANLRGVREVHRFSLSVDRMEIFRVTT